MSTNENLIKSFRTDFERIENEVGRSIIGQKDIIRNVLTSIVVGGNILLEGMPGLGKTRLVKVIGKALDLQFSRIQFTPDLMPADVTGTNIFSKTETSSGFYFQEGPVFSNIVLADEINRATPKTQSALLEAMQEKTVTAGGISHKLPNPFFVLATQNPLELEGTYTLPEAQLDRFLMKLLLKFPSKTELYDIVRITTDNTKPETNKVCDAENLTRMREAAQLVPISKPVYDYAIELIFKGHPELPEASAITRKYIRYGASARGAQALINIARVYALLDGRVNVAFDDIKAAAHPVLRHRLILNFEALSERISADDIINQLI